MRISRDRLAWAALSYGVVTAVALFALTRVLVDAWAPAFLMGAVVLVVTGPVVLLLTRMATISRQVTRTAAQTHALAEQSALTTKELSRVMFHVQKVPAIAGTVSRTRTDLAVLGTTVTKAAETSTAAAREAFTADSSVREPVTLFDPGIVPVTPVAPVAARNVPGRQAAAAESDPELGRKLARLVIPLETDHARSLERRAVAVITTEDVRARLSAGFDVTAIRPSIGAMQIDVGGFSSLVIEEASLTSGPWAGVLDASGTMLYEQLRDLLAAAKSQGTAIILLAADSPASTFSVELRRLANLTVEGDAYELPWGPGLELPVLRALGYRQIAEGMRGCARWCTATSPSISSTDPRSG